MTDAGALRAGDRTAAELALTGAGAGVALGAAVHVAALAGGPEWVAFVGAPRAVVESARDGTWLAPAGALGIAALLAIWALYAFSGARWLRPLPLLQPVLAVVAVIFLLRGALVLPSLHRADWRSPVDVFVVGSSLFILLLGLGYAAGLQAVRRRRRAGAPSGPR